MRGVREMNSNTPGRAVRSVIIAVIAATCFGAVATVAAGPSTLSPAAVASAAPTSPGDNPWG
jgi:hypothetical protein